MTAHPGRDPVRSWQSAAFHEQALAWVRGAVAAVGGELRSELVAYRVRFWSALFTVRSDRGTLWFKATNPGQAFEAQLQLRLSELAPELVLAPLAVHPGHGWLLLPDGGPSLGACGEVTVADWERLVAQAARLQLRLVEHEPVLAATGLPRMAPEDAHAYATGLVEDLARLPPTDPQHVDPELARTLVRGLNEVKEPLVELAASGVPLTLQPNDTSAGNALPAPDGSGYRFFDFGDAFLSHPFAVLQVPVRMAAGTWPIAPPADAPARTRLVDAYVAQWPQVARGAELDRLIDAADRLASLQRCESWRRLLVHVDPDRLGSPSPRLADWIADAVAPRGR